MNSAIASISSRRWSLAVSACVMAILMLVTGVRNSAQSGAAPTLTSVSPSSGPIGTAVTLTGTNFGATAGTSGSLLTGQIGWWGPFQAGATPLNRIAGMPNGTFVGTPAFTADGGGAFTSTDANYLTIPDGGAGGAYDWSAGPWSVQVDFAFPATPVWPQYGSFTLLSKGTYAAGTGWGLYINPVTYLGKYQLTLLANYGGGQYGLVTTYQVAPGAFHRALLVCDGAGQGIWYVNGVAWSPQPCAAPASAATDLVIGRDAAGPGTAAGFPISAVHVWNRALTAAEAVQSTTSDPTAGTSTVTFNGMAATPTSWSATSLVVPVPSGATTGPVVVTVGGQASNALPFTVTTPPQPPSLTTVSPASGPVGTAVTIAGANFGATAGTSTVTFNGTPATPTSWSATNLVVPVPSGATSGPIVVTVGGLASNGVRFDVTTTALRELWVDHDSLGGACSDSRTASGVTRSTPWCTLGAAANHVAPGDEVHVRGGVYTEGQTCSTCSGTAILQPLTPGTPSQWIRFVAEPGETVTLLGGSSGVVDGVVIRTGFFTPSFNEISGFHLVNLSRNCVFNDEVPDIRLINLEITGCGSGAVELPGAQRVTLEGGLIHDNNTTGWTSAVDMYHCRDGNVIRGNRIWSNSDSPVGHDDTEGHGIIMDNCQPSSGALIENNVLWENEGSCINIYQSDGATIRNNTCYHNGVRPGGGELTTSGNRMTIHNNILVPRSGTFALNFRYISDYYPVDPATLQEDSDLFGVQPGDRAIWWGNSVGTLAQYQTQNPGGWGGKSQAADPLFVNAPGGDFHITANSPARDTGDNQHAAAIDIESHPRPVGPAVDRGAYEYVP